MDLLEAFRIQFGARPLLVTLASLLVVFAAARLIPAGRRNAALSRMAARLIAGAAFAGLAAYTAIALWYAGDPHFFDNAEPTLVAVGWLFHLGKPVYHAIDAPERYAHIYGPAAFIFHGAALSALGASLLVSKVAAAAAALASVAATYAACRAHAPVRRALIAAGLCALLYLLFRNYSFWTRPEPLQLLSVAVSLWLAASRPGIGRTIAIGIASGVLWNLKFTGPLYSLPVFVLLQRRSGWRAVAIAAATGAAVAMLPFVAFANVSFADYLLWVRLSARTGLLLSTLRQNIEWAAFLLVPVLLARYAVPASSRISSSEWRAPAAAVVLAMCAIVIAAAKPGAGPYHLLPFIPIVAFLVASSSELPFDPPGAALPRAVIAYGLAVAVLAMAHQAQFVRTMIERRAADDVGDVERFAAAHGGAIEMGYGSGETLSLARPVLVFKTGSYFIDQPAVREHQLEGVAVPRATIDAIAACRVNYWLIPRGDEPFSGRNAYAAVFLRPLYPDALREAFHRTHVRIGSTRYYDVWECRPGGAAQTQGVR